MSSTIACPHCKTKNQKAAQFCKGCGQPINQGRKGAKNDDSGIFNWVANKVNKVLDVTDDFLDAFSPEGQVQTPSISLKPVLLHRVHNRQSLSGFLG